MTLENFLLHIPSVGELCAITSHGYIMQTAYIDDKKLFISGIKNKEKPLKVGIVMNCSFVPYIRK